MILPLPPPIHGASMRNESIVKSNTLQKNFQIRIIPMHFIKDNSDMGKFSLFKVLIAIKLYFKIILEIIRFKPELVYFNMATYGFALFRDLIIVFISKFLNTRILIHLRTQGIKAQAQVSFFRRNLLKLTFKNTIIITLSDNLASDVKTVYDPYPKILNDGIDHLGGSFTGFNKSFLTFLFLSNFLKTKGIYELLDAIVTLKNLSLDFKLIIAGKDVDITSTEIEKYIQKEKLDDFVDVVGPVYGEEKISIYNSADVFVFPTVFEAFPNVILEAMQFGLPVISTIEGAIPEIVENNLTGILIEKGNKLELVDAMKYFILNPAQIEAFGKRGVKRFKKKYTMGVYESAVANVFNNALNQ